MMKRADIFWQTYLKLEKDVIDVSKYIYFTDEVFEKNNGELKTKPCNTQLKVFSPHIADLLLRCCVEIEAISKELYYENGGEKHRGDNSILFDEDCLKLIDIKWETHRKVVMIVSPDFSFTRDENRIWRPLKNAHKRQGTYWQRAYQAVKHDRYSSLSRGNVKALIQALAALFLLNLYYRNDSWATKLKDINNADYSMGSNAFAVTHPIIESLWYGNVPEKGDSPYVAQFSEDDYKRIEEMQNAEKQSYVEYWRSQPELNDPVFVSIISQIQKKEEPYTFMTLLKELGKYRLNKRLPDTTPFEERKAKLLNSDEWRGWVNQNNDHLTAEEINADNIQEEVDRVGTRWGFELFKRLQKPEWISFAMSHASCRVFIS